MTGRMRTIKPGFFTNDALAELDPFARLLFIGLWTLADREGRLEDRPKRIKAELFPYDDVDADALLTDLAGAGFILRYEVAASGRFIQILNFARHQRPHSREAASEFPGPRAVEHDQGDASALPGHTQAIMPFDLGEPAARLLDRPGEHEGDPFAGLGEQAGQVLHHGIHEHGILDLGSGIGEQEEGEEIHGQAAPEGALARLATSWKRAAGAEPTPMVMDMVLEELGLGTPEHWLDEAIREGGANGAMRWRYVERILERFKRSRRFPGESAHAFTIRTLNGPHYGPSEAVS